MSQCFQVKNFERFQHYKDRAPPWIKLYNELLDDYDFARLPDASKSHLIAIWLLASRYENKIPFDAEWVARRINANSPVDLDGLVQSGFIVVIQASSKQQARRKQVARPEREGEAEAEKENKTDAFEEFQKVYPKRKGANPSTPARKAFDAAVKSGVDPGFIIAAVKSGAGYDRDKTGTEFIPRAVTWLRERRWEEYLPTPTMFGTSVFEIAPASDEWNTWRAYYRDAGKQFAVKQMDGAAEAGRNFTVDSQWPPNHKAA